MCGQETLPAIEGLDSESPVVTMSSKGPQLFQLAHELRMPAEVARQASDLFLRHSEGEGNDLFQRRLRMSNFTSLLQDITTSFYYNHNSILNSLTFKEF